MQNSVFSAVTCKCRHRPQSSTNTTNFNTSWVLTKSLQQSLHNHSFANYGF